MRRLPIFLVADVSESMVGETLSKLQDGIAAIVSTLRKDPYALETAYMSVIVFAGRPLTIAPLTEMFAFRPPDLPVGGGTALGSALNHLMDEIDQNVKTATKESKGDWKPLVFLLTDGAPTDDVSPAITRWNRTYKSRVNLVAVSIGGAADHAVLKRITDDVIVFDDSAADAFTKFVRWISMSIQSQSRSVSLCQNGKADLAKPEAGVMSTVADAENSLRSPHVDERFAVILGRCSKSHHHYIAKFARQPSDSGPNSSASTKLPETNGFLFDTVVPIKDNYFELSDGTDLDQSIKSDLLIGAFSCPHCSAAFGMALCNCGKVHCISEKGRHTCPWCGQTSQYEAATGLDIGRGRG